MSSEITVAVNGALGRMGSTVLTAAVAEDGVTPIGGVDIAASGDIIEIAGTSVSVRLTTSLDGLFESTKPDVVVDFTNGEGAKESILTCIDAGVRVVSGSTGLSPEDLDEIGRASAAKGVGVISASNFAIGGVGTLLITGTWMKVFPTLANRDQLHRDLD